MSKGRDSGWSSEEEGSDTEKMLPLWEDFQNHVPDGKLRDKKSGKELVYSQREGLRVSGPEKPLTMQDLLEEMARRPASAPPALNNKIVKKAAEDILRPASAPLPAKPKTQRDVIKDEYEDDLLGPRLEKQWVQWLIANEAEKEKTRAQELQEDWSNKKEEGPGMQFEFEGEYLDDKEKPADKKLADFEVAAIVVDAVPQRRKPDNTALQERFAALKREAELKKASNQGNTVSAAVPSEKPWVEKVVSAPTARQGQGVLVTQSNEVKEESTSNGLPVGFEPGSPLEGYNGDAAQVGVNKRFVTFSAVKEENTQKSFTTVLQSLTVSYKTPPGGSSVIWSK